MSEPEITLEALSDGIALFDCEDELVACNSAFRDLTAPASDVLSDGAEFQLFENALIWRGVYTEAAMALLRDRIAQLVDGSDDRLPPFDLELARSGWHEMRLSMTPEDTLVMTLRDVSAQRMQDAARDETLTFLRTILDTAPASLVVFDMDARRLLFQTPSSRALFGPLDDHVATSWAAPQQRADYLAELLATGFVDRYETEGLNALGEPFPAQLSARIVKHNGNRIIVATSHDMTEPYAQRDALKLAGQRLTDAIEALDQGFALFDADARLVMANSLFRRVNAALADILVPGTPRAALCEAAGAAGLPLGCVAWDPDLPARYAFTLPDGREFAAARSRATDGGTVLVWRDVTEARVAARELAVSREMAFQNEKLTALGELLAGVAHELNNPLSVVVGQALMLQEQSRDPDTRRRIDKISTAAERCARIVKTFLAMARQKPHRTVPAQLNDIIATAVDVAALGPHATDLDIRCSLQPDLPQVEVDEDQIAQIFVNLILNAGQAMEGQAGARLHIATHHAAGSRHVTAEIADNGPGIPPDLCKRVFEPFFTTKDVGEGTGVGLALCRRIATTHGGLLTLAEEDGPGARFLLTLPVCRTVHDATAPAEATPPRAARVLLVEDEDAVADIIADILHDAGAEVHWSASAADALEVLERETFDAILSDLRMPGMGGRQMLDLIRTRFPHMVPRLAFVTGDSMSADAEAIRAEAGSVLLEKPVSPAELRALLARLLDGGAP